jgi:HEAT repeat protein
VRKGTTKGISSSQGCHLHNFQIVRGGGAAIEPNQKDPENQLLRFGLSGNSPGVSLLLGILDQEKDESDRVHVINALANIGSSEAVDVLAERYGNEDEDCRYFTLKAMSYIGSSEAMEFVAREGVHDNKLACKVLAQKAMAAVR